MLQDTPETPTEAMTVARKTWRTVEPIHSMVYFAPEAAESYRRLGLRDEAGYFMSRSAPMGAVGAETVVATFFNFEPGLVRVAMSGGWEAASPGAVVAARQDAADAALRRILGEAVDGPEMARAADLARAAAEAACLHLEGRPLFAGHAGLDWPGPAHLVLWHAQTLLREFRGDGHIAALLANGIGPVEALVLHAASGEAPLAFLRSTRGWSDDQWQAGVDRCSARGWLDRPEADPAGPPVLSRPGQAVRQALEDATDRLAGDPYLALGAEGCGELRALARPFSRAVVASAGLGV